MIKVRKILTMSVLIFFLTIFFEMALKSQIMMNIDSLQDALTWVQHDQSAMMSIFRIMMSFSANASHSIRALSSLIPFSFFILLAIWFIFLFGKIKLRYFMHLLLILINFVTLTLTLVLAFQTQDITYGITLMNAAAKFTFTISILGILIDLILIVLISCDFVELERTIYYNGNEEEVAS